jgi:hypothetical protein
MPLVSLFLEFVLGDRDDDLDNVYEPFWFPFWHHGVLLSLVVFGDFTGNGGGQAQYGDNNFHGVLLLWVRVSRGVIDVNSTDEKMKRTIVYFVGDSVWAFHWCS